MSEVAVLATTVAQQDRTGPTIVFVITILVVVVLLGVVIRRSMTSTHDRGVAAPDGIETKPDDLATEPDQPTSRPDDPSDS